MATKRRKGSSSKSRRSGSRFGGHSRGGIIGAIVGTIATIALIVGILRILGIYDITTLIDFGRSSTPSAQTAVKRGLDNIRNQRYCNILKTDCGNNPYTGNGSSPSSSPDGDHQGTSPGNGSGSTASSHQEQLLTQLNALQVANGGNSAYQASQWPHWTMRQGGCDTREVVLINAGFDHDAAACKISAGSGFSYTDPYTGSKVSDPTKLTIDEVIPLSYANNHNGQSWSDSKRQQFANDTANLVATTVNHKTGSPSSWMPGNRSYTCPYATTWIHVASEYGVSIASSDKTALQTAIRSCK